MLVNGIHLSLWEMFQEKKNNVFLGFGTDDNQAGQLNVAIGTFADIPRSGDQNTLVGYKTGDDMDFGSYNTFLGSQAGKGGAGDYNSNLGYLAGRGNVGDYNVFIGASSGLSLNVNNTLVIESRSSSSMDNYPLIYGDFQENDLTLNATVHISEFLKLQPLDNTPLCNTADLGSIYMDEPSDRLMLCTSNGWKGIIIEP